MRLIRTGVLLATAVTLGIGAPAAMAQTRCETGTVCENRGQGVPAHSQTKKKTPGPHAGPFTHENSDRGVRNDRGPRVGGSARNAPILKQAQNSRLAPPPAGEHYRVMGSKVVRVNDRTQKIVAIVGPSSALDLTK